jgi:hypothetical protein
MEMLNLIENAHTAVHPLKVKKDILSQKIMEGAVGRLEPNPFLSEDDGGHKPVILRPMPTIRSLDFSTGNGYPKFNDKCLELTNDFLMVDTLRAKIESALARGFAITYDWQSSNNRATTVSVNMVSQEGHRFLIAVTDSSSTLGKLKRDSQEAELKHKAFPKKHYEDHLKKPLEIFESHHGQNQAQWVHRNSTLKIHKMDEKGNIITTAEYNRNGELEVTVTERFPISPDDRKAAMQSAEQYLNQEQFRGYRLRHPEFKDAATLAAVGGDVRTIKRPATPMEETNFMTELVQAHVDIKTTEERYKQQSSQFEFMRDMANSGRIYWINNDYRKWHQRS